MGDDQATRNRPCGAGHIHRPIRLPSFAAPNAAPATHSTSHSDHTTTVVIMLAKVSGDVPNSVENAETGVAG